MPIPESLDDIGQRMTGKNGDAIVCFLSENSLMDVPQFPNDFGGEFFLHALDLLQHEDIRGGAFEKGRDTIKAGPD